MKSLYYSGKPLTQATHLPLQTAQLPNLANIRKIWLKLKPVKFVFGSFKLTSVHIFK